jgi:hypothetical protein
MRPARRGNQATDALDTLHTDLADDTHAQAHFSALGELIEVTAQTAPANLRAELQAASEAFARARHSESSTPPETRRPTSCRSRPPTLDHRRLATHSAQP